MGSREASLKKKRLAELDPDTERMFRINAGDGWVSNENSWQTIGKNKYLTLKNPRRLHGAPEGWPDLCGWKTVDITPDMVGQKVAVFVFEEIKATGRLSKMQKKFGDLLTRMGGIFRVMRD